MCVCVYEEKKKMDHHRFDVYILFRVNDTIIYLLSKEDHNCIHKLVTLVVIVTTVEVKTED